MYPDELCRLYPRGNPRLENELNQMKRKLGDDDHYSTVVTMKMYVFN